MRIEDIAIAIKLRQREMQELVFKQRLPHEQYTMQIGVWTGLNDALSIIQDAVRKERENEDSA